MPSHSHFGTGRRFGFAATILLVMVLAACATEPPPVSPLPADLPASLQEYLQPLHQAALSQPDDYRKRTELARAYSVHELWDLASLAFQAAVAIDSAQPQPWYHWALAEARRGNHGRAAELHQRIAEQFPDFAPNLNRLGNLHLQGGELASARSTYATLTRVAPNQPNGYVGMALVHLAQRDFGAAKDAAKQALRRSANNRHAHYVLGLAFRGLGETERAQMELSRGSGSTPDFIADHWEKENWRMAHTPVAALEYARQTIADSQFKRAIVLAERVLEWEPSNLDALNILAVAQLAQQKPREACLALAPALNLDPQHLDTRLNLASCYGGMGNSQAALAHANIAIEIQPNSARAHHLRAKALIGSTGTSNLDEAIGSLQRALELDPLEQDAERELAFLHLNAGQLEQSTRLFEGLVESNPNAPWGYLGLSEIGLRRGDLDRAREALAKARAIAPKHPGIASLQARIAAQEQP